MKRQKPWDQYEAAILLEAYINVHEGILDRKQAITNVSKALRNKAIREGEIIDEIFRNEAGITFQMYSMESAFLGHTVRKPATKLFVEIVALRKNNKPEYDRIVVEAKKMIENKVSIEKQFFTWLSKRVSAGQLSTIRSVIKPLEVFCLSRKIIDQPFFKITDVKEMLKVKETVDSNKFFRFKYKKQAGRMSVFIRYYLEFLKDCRLENDINDNKGFSDEEIVTNKGAVIYQSETKISIPEGTYKLLLSKIENLELSVPIAFYYKGNRYDANSWQNVYINACECLDKDFPFLFKALVGRSVMGGDSLDVGLISDVKKMVKPKEINNQYLVETNLNTKELMNRLAALIKICNLEYDDLVVLYKKEDTKPQLNDIQVLGIAEQIQQEKELFMKWMSQNGMAENTLLFYTSSANRCSKYALEQGYLTESLFLLSDADTVLKLINTLSADKMFSDWNQRQSNRFINALDKYYLFRKGNSFVNTTVMSTDVEMTTTSPGVGDVNIYKAVLNAKFRKGFRIDSNIDLRKFKKTYEAEIGKVCSEDDDAIKHTIRDCGIEYDGKVYLPDAMLSEKKRDKLLTYIDNLFASGKEVAYYSAIFKELSSCFDGERIYTPEMLKTYLKHVASGKYFFEKLYLSTSRDVNIEPIDEVRSYLINKGEAVEKDEICASLSHLPEEKIVQILGSNSEFARNSKGVYFHVDLVPLSDDQLNKICVLIQNDLDCWGYAIGSEVVKNVRKQYPDIFEPYNHFSDLGLRNVLLYRLGKRFSFNSNVISENGKKLTMSDVYANFSRQHKHFTLAELEVLKEETDSGIIYMNAVYCNALRVSKEEFVSLENAYFDIDQTDAAIARYFTGDYIPITDIEEFGTFPYAGYSWNPFLLESYVLHFSKNYKLINNVFNAYTCVGAIVKRTADFNDFRGLLVNVIADSKCDLYPDSALNYLYEKGYIGRRLNKDIESILTDAKVLRLKKG